MERSSIANDDDDPTTLKMNLKKNSENTQFQKEVVTFFGWIG